jgi:hypothetical protein
MLTRLRTHLTYANVTSSLALFLALGGVSYAAVKLPRNSVGVRQLATNAVTGTKVKDGSLTAKDFSSTLLRSLKTVAGAKGADGADGAPGQPGPKGDPGSPGAPGAKGDSGPRGVSSWDTIPSGQAVTGAFEYDGAASVAGDFRTYAKLPGQTPVALTATTVNFAPDTSPVTTDDDATCTGTRQAPTAPAGKVCIYLNNTASDGSGMTARPTLDGDRSSFTISWNDSAAASPDVFVYGTWAYTAP